MLIYMIQERKLNMGIKINPGEKIGIVCCSNGWEKRKDAKVWRLEGVLLGMRLVPGFSCLFFTSDAADGEDLCDSRGLAPV